ncbi:protein N-terminal asparagine amidohydrolase [Ischnura elegans]|uniref:protein N-terminal asparagine amidohydrolase n=1 Tax=Ischnura elegans TaxID=197161 RepID=UPI001ED86FA0|nr:protein N-terminal asparagine amidohydrolase [Ischnura elegans]XP_046398260.1 protein N-terminal asparagine amidohydrolase [Ischnura elegans]XP_046398262.1 protein N-terminal asparagine amidohydrolase [Ischnura elegans]
MVLVLGGYSGGTNGLLLGQGDHSSVSSGGAQNGANGGNPPSSSSSSSSSSPPHHLHSAQIPPSSPFHHSTTLGVASGQNFVLNLDLSGQSLGHQTQLDQHGHHPAGVDGLGSIVAHTGHLAGGGPLSGQLPMDSHTLLASHPEYKESAAHLLSMPVKVIGPMGLLYVKQREMAITVPHDKNVSIIGADDFTTCIAVMLRHTGSGAIGLAHMDGSRVEEGILAMLQKIQELSVGFPEGRMTLSLIGGFSHSKNYSEELLAAILHTIHKQPIEVDLSLACVCKLNTTIRGGIPWPIIYGIGIIVKTGEIFPASFPDKGPDQELRSARVFTGGQQVLDVYDCSLGLLRIGPFNYEPLRGVDLWLQQSDEFILQTLSTAPDVEPPHFVSQVRDTLRHIQLNPFPAVTIFPDNRPRYYRRDENGLWTRNQVEHEQTLSNEQ